MSILNAPLRGICLAVCCGCGRVTLQRETSTLNALVRGASVALQLLLCAACGRLRRRVSSFGENIWFTIQLATMLSTAVQAGAPVLPCHWCNFATNWCCALPQVDGSALGQPMEDFYQATLSK